MSFVLSESYVRSGKNGIIYDASEWSGVQKIAGRVCDDMAAVFGHRPAIYTVDTKSDLKYPVLVGTIGRSAMLDGLEACGKIDLSKVRGKNEVFSLTVSEAVTVATEAGTKEYAAALIIAGSDKRGTIYGLFHLSEMLGVSPFIDWLDLKPARMDSLTLEDGFSYISKEPSVRFRGFFINDEWPAFGNFCMRNYGGVNAKAYAHVFELLLRLKGNYLWPAMWASIFPEDGPGLENAILADELGVVMGASHHEPCCRQGEEYRYVRGKDSVYGDAWNFHTNREGITRFWEDGLKRSGRFENVITVGMRGEADTAILGREATLADNIDLLRDVLKTQNSLIKQYVNENLDEVPRMLALYKEVEPYFYGDETTPGLMGDPELEGVTLMLCDDNFGNLRTLPNEQMLGHKGGYGMYYHFDYHGLPVSFEWYNTSFLPKIWEQMTTAYDSGIRDLWIVNVGDIFSNEFPLAFFLDLAYDYERYGSAHPECPETYTKAFPEKHFTELVSKAQARTMAELLRGYTKITASRRAEAMNDKVYAPFAYGECEALLATCEQLIARADKLRKELTGDAAFGYYELVYLPVVANLNIQRMWLLTTLNHAYAAMGSTYAMALAKKAASCLKLDRALTEELHTIHNGKWYGMGLSEHSGFRYWCEEECVNPILHTFEPADKDRLIVSIPGTDQHTEGTNWMARVLTLGTFLNPKEQVGTIALSTAGARPVSFTVENDNPEVKLSEVSGSVRPESLKVLKVSVDRSKVTESTVYTIVIHGAEGHIRVRIPVTVITEQYPAHTFVWTAEPEVDTSAKVHGMPKVSKIFEEGVTQCRYISMEAEHYYSKKDTELGGFRVLPDYGRTLSAMKAYPQAAIVPSGHAPSITYRMILPEDGRYTVRIYANPSNPAGRKPELWFGIEANAGRMKKVNLIPEGFKVTDGNDPWSEGVLNNIRTVDVTLSMKEGENLLTLYALGPNFVPEKLVVFREGEEPKASYLGPKETWFA
ncbi:MAG: glycosyl hydrolase 115 family protein [Lachnospiraceae bacterium]|nr:glycosyl hydrolase 115 family protein [Lachnospiraceae bacterium]